jgi:hypothetical protein
MFLQNVSVSLPSAWCYVPEDRNLTSVFVFTRTLYVINRRPIFFKLRNQYLARGASLECIGLKANWYF